ncbi:MAG: hypothetical protein JO010_05950 [Alphaproteobacteria bacterium]|nr:hypothetical protein [Alphaproteobacteria bacterium]
MTKDILRYDKMVEGALRGVVREALSYAAEHGLPGGHHFYVTFRTGDPGIGLPEDLRAKFPQEMTVVLEHQFWDLSVAGEAFSVTLSFQNRPQRITIPFAAITAFADPSVKFGLQFQETAPAGGAAAGSETRGLALAAPAETPQKATEPSAPRRPSGKSGGAKTAPGKPDEASAEGGKKPGEIVTLDAFRKK